MNNLQLVIDKEQRLDKKTLWSYVNEFTDCRPVIMLFMINTCDRSIIM